MKEAYVKFGTAQRLKQKGFDWEVNGYFCSDVDNPSRIEWSTKDYNSHKFHVSAPTQQMACEYFTHMKDCDFYEDKEAQKRAVDDFIDRFRKAMQ